MIKAVKDFFVKFFDFKGRTNLKDFWFAIIGLVVLSVILTIIIGLIDKNVAVIFLVIYSIVLLIPMHAMEVRRLHDTNKSGWWVLLELIPIGSLILLICFCFSSVDEGNRY